MTRRRRKAAHTAAAAAAMSEGPVELGSRLTSIPGLVRDTLTGQYPGLTKGRLGLMLMALLYVLSPVDLVPEAMLLVPGLMDDVAIAGWLVAATMGATTGYRAWRVGIDPAGDTAPGTGADPARAHEVIEGEVLAG